jgi:hypothetical protein
MFKIGVRSKFFGLTGALGVLLGANAAFAGSYWIESTKPDSATWGNGDFKASYQYQSSEWSEGSVTSNVTRNSAASQIFQVTTKLFGKSSTPVGWMAGATGSMNRSGTSAATYKDQTMGQAILFNDELFLQPVRDQPCPDHDETWSCTTYEKSLSKTFLSKSADFTLAFVPITVDGSLAGNVTASEGAWARAMPYLGGASSLRSTALAQMGVSAYVEGRLRAFAGIDDVLAVGVTTKIRFIDASLSSKSMSKQDALTTTATIFHTNQMPLTVKSMSGKVTLWADITPLWTEEKTLIDWPGKTWSGTIVGFENVMEKVTL